MRQSTQSKDYIFDGHARIQKILSEWALVDEEREDPNTSISGPSSARQRNAIEMAVRWCADDGPTLNADFQGIWTRIAKKHYFV